LNQLLRPGLQLLLCVALAAGGVSLSRFSDVFVDAGPAGELRFVAMLVVAMLAGIESLTRPAPVALNRRVLWWLILAIGLHMLAASSLMWGVVNDFARQQLYELLLLIFALVLTTHLFRTEPEYGLTLMLLVFVGTAGAFTVIAVLSGGRLEGELPLLGAGGIGAGRVLGMGAIGLLFAYLRRGRIGFLLPIPGFVAGVLLTGSRAAALALAISIVTMLLLEARVPTDSAVVRNRGSVIKGLGLSTLLVGVFLATPYGREVAVNFALSNLLSTDSGAAPTQIYLASRDMIFADALQQFVNSAYGGLGLGVYRGPFGELYPHNMLLGYAVDAGFLGLTGLAISILWPLILLVRARARAANVAVTGALFFLLASLFAGSYYDARFVWVFMLLGMFFVYRPQDFEANLPGNVRQV
jgi:O-antigen ligase